MITHQKLYVFNVYNSVNLGNGILKILHTLGL